MVIANGCPKSGTHALMELLNAMGLRRAPGIVKARNGGKLEVYSTPSDPEPVSRDAVMNGDNNDRFIHGHLQAIRDVGDAIVFNVIRDPRSVLASYVRWNASGLGTGPETAIDAMDDFYGTPFVATYASFLGWAGRAVVLRYEHLPRQRFGGSVYEDTRDASTYNDRPTAWRDWWTEQVAAAWQMRGGDRLLEVAGYS